MTHEKQVQWELSPATSSLCTFLVLDFLVFAACYSIFAIDRGIVSQQGFMIILSFLLKQQMSKLDF